MSVSIMRRKTGTPTDGETHWSTESGASLLQLDSCDSRFLLRLNAVLYCDWQWGNPPLCTTYIDLTNFCHFLRNKDSKYCFFSCNRCSLRFNNGHLLSFRAYLIFLHRASKALSKAANSFIVISWSRLLRNIHS